MHDTPYLNYILLNLKNPILRDLNVRKSLNHLLDKEHKDFTFQQPVHSIVFASHPYFNSSVKFYQFDQEISKKLLFKSNWKKKNKKYLMKFKNTLSIELLISNIAYIQYGDFFQDLKKENVKCGYKVDD